VRLLTIGAFAQAAGLTPKALRIYEKSGLLPPAAVDPGSGYRFYHPGQLPTARLIAGLREAGMPLAEIAQVCAADEKQAVAVISAYGQRITAEATARAAMTALLVQHLSGRSTMNTTEPAVTIRYASALDQGDGRASNEDAVHASDQLWAVADGITGYPAASAAAIAALDGLHPEEATPARLLTMLAGAVEAADRAVRQAPPAERAGAADQTREQQPLATLTALLRSGSRLALVHIGDSRAYLLRDGDLFQLTTDHTWVQSQVDQGKLSAQAAGDHPDRALLIRALGVGNLPVEADLALRTALPGDRYVMCTDGLSAVVDRAALHTTLSMGTNPQQTVDDLLRLAHAAGAPDNIACVVADVVPEAAQVPA
jgi:serine/threonine protein phosphatase PrpC